MLDAIIIGAGPAGLNASLYLSRYGLKHVIIGSVPGGLASTPHLIANWLGIEKINGLDLTQLMLKHVKSYGIEFKEKMASSITKIDGGYKVILANNEVFESKTLILALGTSHRHLGVPGEAEFLGKGISYCATCDGFFFKQKTVAVIGGNDAAATAAVHLGEIADKVYLIYRGAELRAEDAWQKAIATNPKIEIIFNTNVLAIKGETKVSALELSKDFNGSNILNIDGIFIEVGSEPNTELLKECGINMDENGFIIIDATGSTNIPGIYAAGDITTGSNKFRQIITAASEGAIAANSILKYIKQ
ncbi:MAG: FAD-dependent oxidoreductase [bacterium]